MTGTGIVPRLPGRYRFPGLAARLIHKGVHAEAEFFLDRQRTDDILAVAGSPLVRVPRAVTGPRAFNPDTGRQRGQPVDDSREKSFLRQDPVFDACIGMVLVMRTIAVHSGFLSVWLFADGRSMNLI